MYRSLRANTATFPPGSVIASDVSAEIRVNIITYSTTSSCLTIRNTFYFIFILLRDGILDSQPSATRHVIMGGPLSLLTH